MSSWHLAGDQATVREERGKRWTGCGDGGTRARGLAVARKGQGMSCEVSGWGLTRQGDQRWRRGKRLVLTCRAQCPESERKGQQEEALVQGSKTGSVCVLIVSD